jgi:RimJ/RimL family protein N-acetyltransferase
VIPSLQTDRLILRGLRDDDLDAYAAMYADPEVMRYLEDGHPLGRGAAWRSMAVHLGHWSMRGYGQWGLEHRGTGEFVGRAGLWQPEGWPGLEVGWILARPHWGQRYATDAGRAAIAYAFEHLAARHVISLIRPENHASVRVAERLGESYERTINLRANPLRCTASAAGERRPAIPVGGSPERLRPEDGDRRFSSEGWNEIAARCRKHPTTLEFAVGPAAIRALAVIDIPQRPWRRSGLGKLSGLFVELWKACTGDV